ncbi:MAG: phosphomannomutase/phosphoglucomutase [Gammaproteobacteria bacterium]|nr:phosphomannomutase/phosphoglucomutase [Gammaproteobacteria bacterium]
MSETGSRISLARCGVGLFAVSALAVGVTVWVAIDGMSRTLAEQQVRTAAAEAASLQQTLTSRLEGLRRQVQVFAEETETLRVVQDDDVLELRAREQAIARLIPGATRVVLTVSGRELPPAGAFPQLGFADLELIAQMEVGNSPPLEVHLFQSPEQHFDVVVAVRPSAGERPLAGNLLVSFDVDQIQAPLRDLSLAAGYAELQQALGDGSVLVLARTPGQPGRQAAPREISLEGTRWRLSYWPLPARQPAGQSALLIAAAAALALVALAIYGGFALLARVLRRDLRTLEHAAYDVWRLDAALDRYPVALRELAPMIERITAGRPPEDREGGGTTMGREKTTGGEGGIQVSELPVLSASIFKAYDIRGIVGQTLTDDVVYAIGRAIGSEAHDRGLNAAVVARDGRLSGPGFLAALARGIRSTGINVIDIGLAPTPLLYYATHALKTGTGVMVTGSHNPPEYNGFKIMIGGETLAGEGIQRLRQRIESGDLVSAAQEGGYRTHDISEDYIRRVAGDVRLKRPLKLVVDCGNGVAGAVAPDLLRALGCVPVELFCEVDGHFPNHHPDPSQPENLEDLIQAVKERKADLGLAFDGDGDRLGVIDATGRVIWPDRQMMLYAIDVLGRNPGAEIIFDVKCSRHLARVIEEHGGRPLMWRTGHSLVKAKMKETGAPLAGEMSGHIFFKERWYGFDDALYTAARLLEILAADPRSATEVFAALPDAVATPELRVDFAEGMHHVFMEKFLATTRFPDAQVSIIDGLRADFADGWGLVRASNTTPCLIIRFEADDAAALKRVQEVFRRALLAIDSTLVLPF